VALVRSELAARPRKTTCRGAPDEDEVEAALLLGASLNSLRKYREYSVAFGRFRRSRAAAAEEARFDRGASGVAIEYVSACVSWTAKGILHDVSSSHFALVAWKSRLQVIGRVVSSTRHARRIPMLFS